ncbi:hypothetical protein DFH27DRAFT_583784 [Peziza echinospora]|nr:hypothetical protein DFH27DRAFT_583784 [Peziza echinospora]
MGYLLLTIPLAITAGLIQFTLPSIQRALFLFTPFTENQYAVFDPIITQHLEDGTCALYHPHLLTGCEDLHFDGRNIWAGCMGSAAERRKYMPGLGIRRLEKQRLEAGGVGKYMRDRIVMWDVETEEANEVELRGFPEDVDLVLHGFDISVLSPTNTTFYVINHRPFGSVIEKFWHTPGTNHLNFIKTIPIPPSSKGGAPTPNDVFAIPELDHKSAFFVSNDHWFKEGILRLIEDIFKIPFGSHVSYYDDVEGWKIVAKRFKSANGITGTKHHPEPVTKKPHLLGEEGDEEAEEEEIDTTGSTESKPVENTIFLSALNGGEIHAFKREYASSKLHHIQTIKLPGMPDNPTLSYPSQSRVYIAAHLDPAALKKHVEDPKMPVSAGGVFWFRTGQVGEGFYGKGFTGEVNVEIVFLDNKGRLVNAPTTALVIEGQTADGKGDLYVTGVMTEGIMKCHGIV